MPAVASSGYVLVVISAALHAYWNYLLKRAGSSSTFVGLSKVAEVVLFAPVFVVATAMYVTEHPIPLTHAAVLVLIGAALTLGNYVALTRAYRGGDFSLVYPVSRGASLMFLPPLGLLVLGEHIDAVGALALTFILLGLFLFKERGARGSSGTLGHWATSALHYSLLAGVAAAGQTIWNKSAVALLPPFVYFYAYTVLVAAAYTMFLLRTAPRDTIATTWRSNRSAIVRVGCSNSIAYLLVLVALRSGTSSYVIGLRQLSLVFGAMLGVWRLQEVVTPRKRLGMATVLAGCLLLALAS